MSRPAARCSRCGCNFRPCRCDLMRQQLQSISSEARRQENSRRQNAAQQAHLQRARNRPAPAVPQLQQAAPPVQNATSMGQQGSTSVHDPASFGQHRSAPGSDPAPSVGQHRSTVGFDPASMGQTPILDPAWTVSTSVFESASLSGYWSYPPAPLYQLGSTSDLGMRPFGGGSFWPGGSGSISLINQSSQGQGGSTSDLGARPVAQRPVQVNAQVAPTGGMPASSPAQFPQDFQAARLPSPAGRPLSDQEQALLSDFLLHDGSTSLLNQSTLGQPWSTSLLDPSSSSQPYATPSLDPSASSQPRSASFLDPSSSSQRWSSPYLDPSSSSQRWSSPYLDPSSSNQRWSSPFLDPSSSNQRWSSPFLDPPSSSQPWSTPNVGPRPDAPRPVHGTAQLARRRRRLAQSPQMRADDPHSDEEVQSAPRSVPDYPDQND